jgi:hypothetical protein
VTVKATVDITLLKGIALLFHRLWLIDHWRSVNNDLGLWNVHRILLSRILLRLSLLSRILLRLALMHRRISVLLRLAKGSLCYGANNQAC